jgi:hypothetical protein
MYCFDFEKKLKLLNPRLYVYESSKETGHFPGVTYLDPYEGPVTIGAINKNWVPRWSKYDSKGHLIEAGWDRMVRMILTYQTLDGKHITTKAAV